jgi:hypothetical protein
MAFSDDLEEIIETRARQMALVAAMEEVCKADPVTDLVAWRGSYYSADAFLMAAEAEWPRYLEKARLSVALPTHDRRGFAH